MQIATIIISLLLVSLGVIYYMVRLKMKNLPVVADHLKIITLTDKNFQHQTKNKIVLVDFWAAWCAPCRMMAPVINEVADEVKGNVHIGKVDIEAYKSLAQKYQVRSIPTFIVFKNGNEVSRFSGMKNKDFLLKQLRNI